MAKKTVEILQKRMWNKSDYCIGVVSINGKYFCESLEDTDRGLDSSMTLEQILEIKKKGKTAIPKGRYKIVWAVSKKFMRPMPYLENVKGFGGIMLHWGNKPEDTDGCPLYGENKKKGMVINSKKTCEKLFDMIKDKTTYITIS